MPRRPTAKSSYLTKIHSQRNFLSSSSQLNQFTALSSFYLVVNKDRLNFVMTVGRGFTSQSEGLFHHFKQGQSFANGIWLSCKYLDDVINVRQKMCDTRVLSTEMRQPGELRAFHHTLICVLIWICTP